MSLPKFDINIGNFITTYKSLVVHGKMQSTRVSDVARASEFLFFWLSRYWRHVWQKCSSFSLCL